MELKPAKKRALRPGVASLTRDTPRSLTQLIDGASAYSAFAQRDVYSLQQVGKASNRRDYGPPLLRCIHCSSCARARDAHEQRACRCPGAVGASEAMHHHTFISFQRIEHEVEERREEAQKLAVVATRWCFSPPLRDGEAEVLDGCEKEDYDRAARYSSALALTRCAHAAGNSLGYQLLQRKVGGRLCSSQRALRSPRQGCCASLLHRCCRNTAHHA